MAELKPCPFCGGEAEVRLGNIYTSKVVKVRCTSCFCSTDFVFIDHPELNPKTGKLKEETRYSEPQAGLIAMAMWNRRAENGNRKEM